MTAWFEIFPHLLDKPKLSFFSCRLQVWKTENVKLLGAWHWKITIHYSDIINYFYLPVMKLQNAFGQRQLISFRACRQSGIMRSCNMNTHKRDFTFPPELIISDRGGKLRDCICCCMQAFNISLKSQLWKKNK